MLYTGFPGLDILPRSRLKRQIALGGGLAALLISAELSNGYVTGAVRWLKRSFSAAVAQWLEDQGGFPLFTVEGEEPEDAKHSWDLPSSFNASGKAVQGAADVAGQLGDRQDNSGANIGSFASPASSSATELPNFFASTKFFSCLDLKESQELFEATQMVTVGPHETLFQMGESSGPGIFIVLEGQLGVFLQEGDQLRHTNTLRIGESVGDYDVLDGARRSVTCMALDEGAVLVQVSWDLFLQFISAKPRTLQLYLHKGIGRLWRVAHFVLSDFLNVTLEEASSNKLSEATNFSAMAQLNMPENTAQRPLSQPKAQLELNQLRAGNAGKPQPAAATKAAEDVAADLAKTSAEDAEVIMQEIDRLGDEEDEQPRQESETEASSFASTSVDPPSPASEQEDESVDAATHDKQDNRDQLRASKQRTARGVRFHPSLSAVSEISLESDQSEQADSTTLRSPFQAYADRSSSAQAAQAAAGATPAGSQESLLTASLRRKEQPSEIAESPFASMSQQSSGSSVDTIPEGTAKEDNKGKAIVSGLSQLKIGEVSEQAEGEPTRDSDIASSINNAMRQLRAASLPAAFVRDVVDLQGGSPTGASPHSASNNQHSLQGAMSTRPSSHSAGQACLSYGWDVLSPEDCQLSEGLWARLTAHSGKRGSGMRVALKRGDLLLTKDQPCRQFYILLEGCLLAERMGKGGKSEPGLIVPGSLIACASFLSSSRNRESVRASQSSTLAVFGPQELDALMKRSSSCFVELLLAAARALGPVIRRFISLGLNRVWLDAGDAAYRQRENATCLYIIISGRLRLVREDPSARPPVRVEEEVGRGEAVGAVWALAGGYHDTTALCVRDAELVRMSRGAFELIVAQCPLAVAGMLSGMGRRLAAASAIRSHRSMYDPSGRAAVATPVPAASSMHNGATGGGTAKRGEVVTIALVPAGCQDADGQEPAEGAGLAIKKLGGLLKQTLEELFGPTLLLSSSSMELMFPTSFGRLSTTFYRSKVTSWMAAQEEDYRFIVMEADSEINAWTCICVSQADCILLIGAEDAAPSVNFLEHSLIWASMGGTPEHAPSYTLGANSVLDQPPSEGYGNAKIWAARMRRVELVLLHPSDADPTGTIQWLKARPHLARHHHVRLSHSKDLARVARWMAGKAVGLVLSGGGSRGLAHLGVLHALDDAGVPVDVIGGTSQGAFMAGLYAQGLTWEQMHRIVRKYALQMGSVRHLLSDLTLPIVSVFTGRGFDRVVREAFATGAQNMEDLWLRYFCITTNLSRGEPSVHERGTLWRLVRASMTIVGLVPPVYHEGELLVDGGYLNNIPVDVMRGLGVDSVIVVDVEDKDASVWRNLSAYDGGISGWQLLWDRWCPIPSLRYGLKLPRYQQILNTLTWMSHTQNLKRVSREHVIDLYLQPPVGKFRLMDFHLMERLVRDANRYAFGAIAEWQCRQGVTQQGMIGVRPLKETARLRMRRAHSIPCMTQLQIKHSDAYSGGESQESSTRPSRDPEAVRAATMVPGQTLGHVTSSSLADIHELTTLHSGRSSLDASADSTPRDAARPKGLFQIVGPMAIPSGADLASLDGNGPNGAIGAAIESLPSRRLTHASSSALAADFPGRRPSLEAQLQPINSETAKSWLPSSRMKPGSIAEDASEAQLPQLAPLLTQLSVSAPAVPASVWPSGLGEGALALPNQAILPEDSRPLHVVPEVRRPSLTIDATLLGQQSSRAARGLTSRPSFTEADRQGPNPDDDLAHIAVLLHGSTDSSDDTSSSGTTGSKVGRKAAATRSGAGGTASRLRG